MNYKIALIPGDGIGPEVIAGATYVLDAVGKKFGHTFSYETLLAGGAAIDATGKPLPQETIDACKASDSVLLGAVGGPKWDNIPGVRPEQALLGLRGALGLFSNLRPAILFDELRAACPLKEEIVKNGFDVLIVRELTGGIYFGESGRENGGDTAFDTERYSKFEIERIVKSAVGVAKKRKKHITLVDKANVLESSRLWREVAKPIFAENPDITVDYMYVDNASMQLVKDPGQFDVVVTSNIFGDILSDEVSMLTGSIGMLPSASLAEGNFGMYEPAHGSAPDIAGQGIANPLATIMSAAMMLRYSFGLLAEADAVDGAVKKALADGFRTGDIKDEATTHVSGTMEMAQAVVDRL